MMWSCACQSVPKQSVGLWWQSSFHTSVVDQLIWVLSWDPQVQAHRRTIPCTHLAWDFLIAGLRTCLGRQALTVRHTATHIRSKQQTAVSVPLRFALSCFSWVFCPWNEAWLWLVCHDILRSEVTKNVYQANALAIVVPGGQRRLFFTAPEDTIYLLWDMAVTALCLTVNNDCSQLVRLRLAGIRFSLIFY